MSGLDTKATAPSVTEVARRLAVLHVLSSHAIRLMMVWNFGFRARKAISEITGETPHWADHGLNFSWLRIRARWNWWWERRGFRESLTGADLWGALTLVERRFTRMGLDEASARHAGQALWQVEAAAVLAWAIRLLPRIWPMHEQFDGSLDEALGAEGLEGMLRNARLRPLEEIQTEYERVVFWHWRARQYDLEKEGYVWPPREASPETVADLKSKGLDSLDAIVRAAMRVDKVRDWGVEIIDEDLSVEGRPYRSLAADEVSELRSIAMERHRALGWLRGLAPGNDWSRVPLET
jgi:hypothetical protein